MPTVDTTLFNVLRNAVGTGMSASQAGYAFEDIVSRSAFTELQRQGIFVFPPRHTLQSLPTTSGLSHQFDVVAKSGQLYYLVECKRRQNSNIEQVFAFAGKVLDYVLAGAASNLEFKAIFLSASSQLHDNHRQYALSLGITPLSEDLPPPSALLSTENGLDRSVDSDVLGLVTKFEQTTSSAIIGALRPSQAARPRELLLAWKALKSSVQGSP